jgi:hypothetical protein
VFFRSSDWWDCIWMSFETASNPWVLFQKWLHCFDQPSKRNEKYW